MHCSISNSRVISSLLTNRQGVTTSDAMTSCKRLTRESRKVESNCKVCGAIAHCSYLGVKACAPCKMFFKRNAKFRKVNQTRGHLVFFIIFICLGTAEMRS